MNLSRAWIDESKLLLMNTSDYSFWIDSANIINDVECGFQESTTIKCLVSPVSCLCQEDMLVIGAERYDRSE